MHTLKAFEENREHLGSERVYCEHAYNGEEYRAKDTWFLSETKLRTDQLQKVFQKNDNARTAKAYTFGDAVWRIFSLIEMPGQVRRLTQIESDLLLLSQILNENSSAYPILRSELDFQSGRVFDAVSELRPIRRLFDVVRLQQLTNALIAQSIDELGNIHLGKERTEELIRLLDGYRMSQSENGHYDAIGALETLTERLHLYAAKKSPSLTGLPDLIVLDSPTQIHLLEREFLILLSQFVPIRLYLPEQVVRTAENFKDPGCGILALGAPYQELPKLVSKLPPSERSLASVIYFVSQLPKTITAVEIPLCSPQRKPLPSVAFDGVLAQADTEAPPLPIAVWDCAERRDEVVRLVRVIRSALDTQQSNPQDFHVVALELDSYQELLEQEFLKEGIPYRIPRGRKILQSGIGSFAQAFLHWHSQRTLTSLRAYVSHPWFSLSGNGILNRELQEHFLRYLSIFPARTQSRGADYFKQSQEFFSFEEFFRIAAIFGLPEDFLHKSRAEFLFREYLTKQSRQLEESRNLGFSAENKEREFFSIILALAFLEDEKKFREGLVKFNTPNCSMVRPLMSRFRRLRKPLKSLKFENNKLLEKEGAALQFSLAVLRKFQSYVRQAWESILLSVGLFGEDFTNSQGTFELLCEEVQKLFEREYLVSEESVEDNAVIVSELLDVRGMQTKYTAVLGVTSSAFPAGQAAGALLGNDLDVVSAKLALRSGGVPPLFESYSLCSLLLRESRELVFSSPRLTEKGEASFAPFLQSLVNAYPTFGSSEGLTCLKDPPEDWQSAQTRRRLPNQIHAESHRAIELLQGRHSASFSRFDGALTGRIGFEDLLRIRQHRRPARAEEFPPLLPAVEYSVSELEEFADCPHRFFFSGLLGLRPAPQSIDEQIIIEVGKVTHRALEVFFGQKETKSLANNNFEQASIAALKCCEDALHESLFCWTEHPFWRFAKEQIIAGLGNTGQGKRGFVKAALFFQNRLIETQPIEMEYRFGGGQKQAEHQALRIEQDGQLLFVKGVIDRIDGPTQSGAEKLVLGIWDYKTGKAPSVGDVDAGRSLQVPLYALFIQQKFPPYLPPKRGGIICLAKPNRIDEELASPRKGVLLEHLAIKKTPGSTELDETLVAVRIEAARQKALALDRIFREGAFHQRLETKGCDYCQFRKICVRDESMLELKLQTAQQSAVCEMTTENLHNEREEFTAKHRKIFQNSPLQKIAPLFLQPKTIEFRNRELSEEQRAATDTHSHIVLTAGAGSGKTTVMTTRVVKLIREGVPLQAIVAITFTEKAALEIKERLERLIRELLYSQENSPGSPDGRERGYLLEAQAQLSQAHIGTIHSFATTLVRMDPLLSGIREFERILVGGEQQALLQIALDDLIHSGAREKFTELFQKGIRRKVLIEELRALALKPTELAMMSAIFQSEENFQALRRAVAKSLQTLRVEVEEALKNYLATILPDFGAWLTTARMEKDYFSPEQEEKFLHVISAAESLLQQLNEGDNAQIGDVRMREDWMSAYSELLEFLHTYSKMQKIRSKKCPQNFWLEIRKKLEAFEKKIQLLHSPISREDEGLELTRKVTLLATQLRDFYSKHKKLARAVDFDDLILGAERMFTQNSRAEVASGRQERFLKRVQQEFLHVMVDEFQDTDPAQWRIVKGLLGKDLEQTETGKTNRTLFVVGDVQQAIYGFRGGDVRVFREATAEITRAGGKELSLVDNYRSSSGILNFVNPFFERLFGVDFDSTSKARSSTAVHALPMSAQRKGAAERTLSILWTDLSQDGGSAKIREAEQVATFVQEVLSTQLDSSQTEPRWPALFRKNDGPKIAILTRTGKQLSEVAKALEKTNVPFSISHNHGFFDLEEILQMENLLKVLLSPSALTELVGLLRAPIFGFGDDELLLLYQDLQGDWASLWKNSQSSSGILVSEISESLQRWRNMAQLLPTSLLLERIVEERQLEQVYFAASKSEAFRNIQRFIDVLRRAEYSSPSGSTLAHALCWLEAQHEDNTSAPNANNVLHPVVLSTVHGAKGLEFPMVILPFLESQQPNEFDFILGEISLQNEEYETPRSLKMLGIQVEDESQEYQRSQTLLQFRLKETNRELRASEARRLFYVACTRAQDYLVLSLKKEKSFEKDQKDRQTAGWAAKNELVYQSFEPGTWLKNLIIYDFEGTGTCIFEQQNGERLEIPAI